MPGKGTGASFAGRRMMTERSHDIPTDADPPGLDDDALVAALRDEAAAVDVEHGFPSRSIALLRLAGWLSAATIRSPRRRRLFDRLATVGRGSLPVGRIFEGHVNALLLVEAYGTPEQVARHEADAAAGHLFAVWNTEAADGVRLQLAPDRIELHGSKTFATAAGHATRAVVTGNDAEGRRWMVVVDTDRTPPELDRTFWRPLGMRPTASAMADFGGITLPPHALLGGAGDYYREPMFSTGAARFAAVQLGGAEAVFDETRHFLRRLGRTDDPYQRARLGEMAMCIATGRHWLAAAAARLLDPPGRDPAVPTTGRREADAAFAHLMRIAVEDLCLRVLPLAERSVGARGLLRPEPFERLHRDLTHYLRQGSPDAVLAAAGAYVLSRGDSAPDLFST